MKRLVAIGAAVSANCRPCLELSMRKAREDGAEETDIKTAIEIGRLVRNGAASGMDRFSGGVTKPVGALPHGTCDCDS